MKIALITLVALPTALLEALMLQHLWRWFAVPAINAPGITLTTAFGIMVVVDFIRPDMTKKDVKTSELLEALAARTIIFGAGYMCHVAATTLST